MISIWSFEQGPETKGNRKLKFTYGNNLVSWNSNGEIHQRYYYIFHIEEIKELFDIVGLKIIEHFWVHGNEVFILET
jgi:hypothetical protein